MSLEYKTVEVSNEEAPYWIKWMSKFGWSLKSSQRIYNRSSRPVGALTYENLTYIHSETSVVDFTELLFERKTSMPNYYEICELEKEAFELVPYCNGETRPYEPVKLTFDEWIDGTSPSPFTKGEFTFRTIITSIILALVVTAIIIACVGLEDGDSMGMLAIAFVILIPAIPLSYLFTWISGHIVRMTTKNNASSRHYKKLTDDYDCYCRIVKEQLHRVEMFDYAYKRIPEIFEEAFLLS
jgi:hypothetical protein